MKLKIVFVSTVPPTQCGIATYTKDLIDAFQSTFENLECIYCKLSETSEVVPDTSFTLNYNKKEDYRRVAEEINADDSIRLVHIQHEFGLFGGHYGDYLLELLEHLKKPIAFTFHSVIPNPHKQFQTFVQLLASYSSIIFAMTRDSKNLLQSDYHIDENLITYVPHGTHIVAYNEPNQTKKKLGLENHKILSTFGLLGTGKSIETAINALPEIIENHPDTLYLVIGKSHPKNIKDGVDPYRQYLKNIISEKKLDQHVLFIDRYLELEELLEYLRATDVYLFTSKNPEQAVSGTFAYAMSCSCPIVATSIPHIREELSPDTGIIVDIGNSRDFSRAVNKLLSNDALRESMAINAYQKTRESSWENVAIKHFNAYTEKAKLFSNVKFRIPKIKLIHIRNLTTSNGIIQFSKINLPDINSGYTLDDNARALIMMSMHYMLFRKKEDLLYIEIYLNFLERSQQPTGNFINYIDQFNQEHIKNSYVNLEDSNARAVWALGTLISFEDHMPAGIIKRAVTCFLKCKPWVSNLLSPRAIGFSIKGLYAYYVSTKEKFVIPVIEHLANNLITKYDLHATKNWKWFENYMTYANSVLPEAMIYAYLTTGNSAYKKAGVESLDFLLSKMFLKDGFKVISNKGWYHKNKNPMQFGEQPIDVAYTIQTLNVFYQVIGDKAYKSKMNLAFEWFLGRNQLSQIMYNPVSGGCFDGLEEKNVNLNQGAESAVCYLMARLIIEQYHRRKYEKRVELGEVFNQKGAPFI